MNHISRRARARCIAPPALAGVLALAAGPLAAQQAGGAGADRPAAKDIEGVRVTAQRGATLAEQADAKARFTAAHNRIAALNDGIIPESAGPEQQQKLWGSWGSPQPYEELWVEYRWKQPVRISQSTVYFWADQSLPLEAVSCADLGVQFPAHWTVMYYDDQHEWVEVAHPSGYPVRFGGASEVDFDPVRTTRLRVVMEPFGRGRCRAAVGIKEWSVQ